MWQMLVELLTGKILLPGCHPRDADLIGQSRSGHRYFCPVPVDLNVQPVPRNVLCGLIRPSRQLWGNENRAPPTKLGPGL